MNARGEIYRVPRGTEVPAEDRARLEGYLMALDDRDRAELAPDVADAWRDPVAERLRLADEHRRRYRRRNP